MKKVWYLGVILAAFLVLTTLQTVKNANKEPTVQGGRYHPNGAEAVFVGAFGG